MKHAYTATLILTLALAGCAQSPVAEIDGAKQALDRARDAQAPDYAPEAWNAANDAQSRLDAELDAQKNKTALFRSYSKSKDLAAEVKSAAECLSRQPATSKCSFFADWIASCERSLTSTSSGNGASR